MARYDGDTAVFVEDITGDHGATPSPDPWWLSPDVDIVGTSGTAVQGANTVRVRVHKHEPPVESKIRAEVWVGNPSVAMSPTNGTIEIDPGNLLFRSSSSQPGTQPIATEAGV